MKSVTMRLHLANIDEVLLIYGSDVSGMEIRKVTLRKPEKSIYNQVLPTTSSSDVYTVSTKSGEKMVIACSSCATEGMVECWWCSYPVLVTENVGIIVRFETNGSEVVRDDRTGFTCCEECSLAYVLEQKKKGKSTPSMYIDSDYYHRTLYNMSHPGEGPLIPSNNPTLLKSKGGGLTREEWADKRHIYVQNSHFIPSSLKSPFTRINVK
jgi:hypothetical protein